MYIIGILLCVNYVLSILFQPVLPPFNKTCGINNKAEYHYTPMKYKYEGFNEKAEWSWIVIGIYIIWDNVTLILYRLKIFAFKSYHDKDKQSTDGVYQRILHILYRIIVATLFYRIFPWNSIVRHNSAKGHYLNNHIPGCIFLCH